MSKLEQLAYELPSWSGAMHPAPGTKRCLETNMEEEAKEPTRTKQHKTKQEIHMENEVPAVAARQSVLVPLVGECGHCGEAHPTKRCTFGSNPCERYLPCAGTAPQMPCFWRRFIVPLGRANALKLTQLTPAALVVQTWGYVAYLLDYSGVRGYDTIPRSVCRSKQVDTL